MDSYLPARAADVQCPFIGEESSQLRHLALLAPSIDLCPAAFERTEINHEGHSSLMSQMQILRGRVYLADGAIQPIDLDESGRHKMRIDHSSFHLLALNVQREVVACCRFYPHPSEVRYEDLGIARSPLAWDQQVAPLLRNAVTTHIQSARARGYLYVEIGGWALDQSVRHSTEAVRIALLNFSLGLAMGGAVGICTATERNHSATILQRMGGLPLSTGGFTIPSYHDDNYGCRISVVTFDSDLIPSRHRERIEKMQAAFKQTPVLCSQQAPNSSLLQLFRQVNLDLAPSRAPSEYARA